MSSGRAHHHRPAGDLTLDVMSVALTAEIVVAHVVVTVEVDAIALEDVDGLEAHRGAVAKSQSASATTTVVVTGTVVSAVTGLEAPRTGIVTARWRIAMKSVSVSLASVSMSERTALPTARSLRVRIIANPF